MMMMMMTKALKEDAATMPVFLARYHHAAKIGQGHGDGCVGCLSL